MSGGTDLYCRVKNDGTYHGIFKRNIIQVPNPLIEKSVKLGVNDNI